MKDAKASGETMRRFHIPEKYRHCTMINSPDGPWCLADEVVGSLAEKDREIERLTAVIKREMGEDYLSLQALYIQKLGEVRGLEAKLSASQAREREAMNTVEGLMSELEESKAREREAVERAEKAEHHERVAQDALSSADCRYAGRVVEMGGSHCPIGEPCDRCAADRRERELEAALAAARKALEDLASAILRKNADGKPMHSRQGLNNIARAVLNGDSHEQI